MAGQGFASMSTARRKEIARKGAKALQSRKKAYTFTADKAREAAKRGHASRKARKAKQAAMRLMKAGFSPGQLGKLNLTQDEVIYYGGPKAGMFEIVELRRRLGVE